MSAAPALDFDPRPANAVEIANVTKRYGRTEALKGVSFDVRNNELFALLGPNGAGKTTLIHILCTILKPDSGTARLAGHDILKDARRARQHLGVVFQEPSLDTRLTVEENLDFHGLVYKVPYRLRKQRIKDLLELVELSDWSDKLVRHLSSGMKRRAEIARALIHDSRVVILDEPTVGLDAQSRDRIWHYLRKLKDERQLTVIVTTHYIEEVENCDRVCIIDHGQILALDTPEALKRTHGKEIIRLVPRDAATGDAIRARFPEALSAEHDEIIIKAEDDKVGEQVLSEFGTQVRHLSFDRPSLESVFLNLTGRELRDRAAGVREQTAARSRGGAEPPR